LTIGAPTVTVRVGVANASAYAVGAAVAATSVSDAGVSADGQVASVSEFKAGATDSGDPPGYDVTITLASLGGLHDSDRVTVAPVGALPTISGTAVPLTALRAESEKSYVLVAGGGGAGSPTRRVEVEVLGSADGYAIVKGAVHDGDRVLVSSRS
jgi:hypothetical protein